MPPPWEEVGRAFADSHPMPLRQHWKETPEKGLSPAEVRTAWTPAGLWIYAVMEDDDIYNNVTERNAFFFQKGDVFEIFVRPEAQDAYFEFHLGPENQQLQLRIPSADAFANQAHGECEGWKIAEPHMQSWVQVDALNGVWRVLALLPFESIVDRERGGQDWLISFCRYDYTRGVKNPVLSSSSPHAKLGFHRQHEWTRLRFSRGEVPPNDNPEAQP